MASLTVIQLHSTFRFPSNVSVTTRDGLTKLPVKLSQSVRSIVIDFSWRSVDAIVLKMEKM